MMLLVSTAFSMYGESSSEYYEATESFFSNPKNYSVEYYSTTFGIPKYCSLGQFTFAVGNNTYSFKSENGEGETYTFTPRIKNITVMANGDEYTVPMYTCSDGRGIRAIKFADGHYIVMEYIGNNSIGFYIPVNTIELRK